MSEEKKEQNSEKKVEVPKAEAPKADAAKPEEPAQSAEVKKPEEKKIEKPANCSVCNKSIKKKRYYYRNGKYFCTKRCWSKTAKKEEKKDAGEQKAGPEAKQ